MLKQSPPVDFGDRDKAGRFDRPIGRGIAGFAWRTCPKRPFDCISRRAASQRISPKCIVSYGYSRYALPAGTGGDVVGRSAPFHHGQQAPPGTPSGPPPWGGTVSAAHVRRAEAAWRAERRGRWPPPAGHPSSLCGGCKPPFFPRTLEKRHFQTAQTLGSWRHDALLSVTARKAGSASGLVLNAVNEMTSMLDLTSAA